MQFLKSLENRLFAWLQSRQPVPERPVAEAPPAGSRKLDVLDLVKAGFDVRFVNWRSGFSSVQLESPLDTSSVSTEVKYGPRDQYSRVDIETTDPQLALEEVLMRHEKVISSKWRAQLNVSMPAMIESAEMKSPRE